MARIKYQEAAGLEVKRGRPPLGPAPSKADLVRLYIKEGLSVRDVAAKLGCSKDMVYRALKQFGIDARPNANRSKLRTIPFRILKADIRKKGIRGTARNLKVDEATLWHRLKVRNNNLQMQKMCRIRKNKLLMFLGSFLYSEMIPKEA